MTAKERAGRAAHWVFVCSVLVGAGQLIVQSVRHFLLNDFLWVSRDFVWMAPVGYLLFFVSFGVPLVLASWLIPIRQFQRIGVFVCAFVGGMALTLLFPRMHILASLFLAVGIGARAASFAATTENKPYRVFPRWAVGLLVTPLVIGIGSELTSITREARELRSLPTVNGTPPNVLLIVMDTVRAESMGFNGYSRDTTPHLDEFAKGGVVFENAFSTAPWTLPSHASMFTGQYPFSMGADWLVPLDSSAPILAETLRNSGYVTGGFAANHYYTTWESGLERGFIHYDDYHRSLNQVLFSTAAGQTDFFQDLLRDPRPISLLRRLRHPEIEMPVRWHSDRKLASSVAGEFLDWESKRRGRPFFAFLNLFDAHRPYEPPEPWEWRFSKTPNGLDRYDGAIGYMDQEIGRLLQQLEERDVLDQTLVIITSDHGEQFGEHGLTGHGNSLYLPLLHVPLLIRYPGRVPADRRVQLPVSLRDLPATVLNLTGVDSVFKLEGTTLANSWMSNPNNISSVVAFSSAGINTPPEEPVSRGKMRSLIEGSFHYIHNGDGVEELYNYEEDPKESHDLAREMPDVLDRLRRKLLEIAGPNLN